MQRAAAIESDSVEPAAPAHFYQYWSLTTPPERRAWLERLLLQREIFFRSREVLNDPTELRPRVVTAGTRDQIRDYVRYINANYRTPVSPAKRLIQEHADIRRVQGGSFSLEVPLHELLGRIGVLSLSECADDPLLWAHYADGYRGVCVEFDATAGLFAGAQRVRYTDVSPVVNRFVDSGEVLLQKSMFTKALSWSYEKEWRIIARWRDVERGEMMLSQGTTRHDLWDFVRAQNGPGYYQVVPGAVTAVWAGPNIRSEDFNWLAGIVTQCEPTIGLSRTRVVGGGHVEPID